MSASNSGIHISKRSFLSSLTILLCLVIIAGILARTIPPGQFDRMLKDGRETVLPGSFRFISADKYPIWRWFTAPFEVLSSPDAATVVVIILYLFFIGGTFTILEKSGILRHSLERIVLRFQGRKYHLMAGLVLFFMLLGALIGVFEESIVLVPITVALAISLGWDSLTGLGMSLLAAGFGFAAAIGNPFTIGVAQSLADLPAYSGSLYRILIFLIIYFFLLIFLIRYAKKIEKEPKASLVYQEDQVLRQNFLTQSKSSYQADPHIVKATRVFSGFLLGILLVILSGLFVPGLSDYTIPILAIIFLAGGIIAGKVSRYENSGGSLWRDLLKGMAGIAPGMILILLAMSVKQIMTASQTMDTILFWASEGLGGMSPYLAGFSLYLLILLLEFFISSGSAKAFLVIPIITPLVDIIGLTRQAAVQAFCFGDGFSNVLFPTNAALMIALGLTVVSYPKWLRWTLPIQALVFVLTVALLMLAIWFGYGPF